MMGLMLMLILMIMVEMMMTMTMKEDGSNCQSVIWPNGHESRREAVKREEGGAGERMTPRGKFLTKI